MPLRIAHLLAPGPFGGAESVVRALAVGRVARGGPTQVFAAAASTSSTGPFVDPLRAGGVPVIGVEHRGRRYVSEIRQVADLIRRHEIQVLHTHVYRSDFIGFAAARLAGIPVVSTFHGECGGNMVNRLYEWSVKRLFRWFDAVICVAEANLHLLEAAGCDTRHAFVVPNGITVPSTMSRREACERLGVTDTQKRIVGWIGRFSREKGPDSFVDAIMMSGVEVAAVMVGDGPDRAKVGRRAQELGLSVRFTGAVPDAARLLSAFDLVVSSSRAEGLPIVLLEAFAARIPVVGFAVGGVPRVLTDRTGWPVPPGDLEALSASVKMALDHPQVALERAGAAKRLVTTDYGLPKWLERVETVYEVVHQGRKSAGDVSPARQ